MSTATYLLVAAFMGATILWQLKTGEALGAWWSGRILRAERPRAFWLILAMQCAILVTFLVTGKSWLLR